MSDLKSSAFGYKSSVPREFVLPAEPGVSDHEYEPMVPNASRLDDSDRLFPRSGVHTAFCLSASPNHAECEQQDDLQLQQSAAWRRPGGAVATVQHIGTQLERGDSHAGPEPNNLGRPQSDLDFD